MTIFSFPRHGFIRRRFAVAPDDQRLGEAAAALRQSAPHLLIDPTKQPVRVFLWIYFIMTGLHALHMIVGAGILIILIMMAQRGKFTKVYNSPVEISGLYWHFVDIVWIFLFPLLYLTGFHYSPGGGH